jgi:hypothetical protein
MIRFTTAASVAALLALSAQASGAEAQSVGASTIRTTSIKPALILPAPISPVLPPVLPKGVLTIKPVIEPTPIVKFHVPFVCSSGVASFHPYSAAGRTSFHIFMPGMSTTGPSCHATGG